GYGSGRTASCGRPAGGKTGTSEDYRDAWFVGYTANLVTGVWFGNDNSKPTKATGSSIPARAWKEFMAEAHKGISPRELPGNWQPRHEILQVSSEPQSTGGPITGPRSIIDAILGY